MRLAQAWLGLPASEQELAAIRALAPSSIRDELERFYLKHNGAERSFDDVDYGVDRFDSLRIDDIARVTDPETRSSLDRGFPGFWVIGSDGGGQLVAYDMREALQWPIVLILPGDGESPLVLAKDLDELSRLYFDLGGQDHVSV